MKHFFRTTLNSTLTAAFLGLGLPAMAEEKVDIMVSPQGSGPYLAWATIQTYAKDFHDELRPIAVETPGFVYNVRFFASNPDLWKNTMIGSGEVVEWAAANGIPPFFPEPLEAAKDFRVIGTMTQSSNLFVATDPAIQSPHDFEDKRIATGLLSQNEWGMHQRLIVEGMGLMDKVASFSPLGPGANVEALLDGRADVGTVVLHSAFGLKKNLEAGPFKTLESSGRDWHFVSIDPADVQKYIDETGAPFKIREIPAGTMTNQTEPVTTLGNNVLLTAHKDMPEETAYEFVKLWVKMGPTVAEYNAVGGIWDAESIAHMANTQPDRIHPGAMRAYKELGLIK
ncbi:MAG: TAXI family TRAP transporter solute-binding subunit [Paracoccaceae bacterium]